MSLKIVAGVCAVAVLAGCGGGGGGNSPEAFAARFAALQSDPTIISPTSNATVAAQSGTSNYAGVINISTDNPSDPDGASFYYGNIAVGVNFNSGDLSGSANGFQQYFSEIASAQTGSAVPGSLTISGSLEADNESQGDGITGIAAGSIDGFDVSYTMDGNITGVSANGMTLGFDGPDLSGGVAILVK